MQMTLKLALSCTIAYFIVDGGFTSAGCVVKVVGIFRVHLISTVLLYFFTLTQSKR